MKKPPYNKNNQALQLACTVFSCISELQSCLDAGADINHDNGVALFKAWLTYLDNDADPFFTHKKSVLPNVDFLILNGADINILFASTKVFIKNDYDLSNTIKFHRTTGSPDFNEVNNLWLNENHIANYSEYTRYFANTLLNYIKMRPELYSAVEKRIINQLTTSDGDTKIKRQAKPSIRI